MTKEKGRESVAWEGGCPIPPGETFSEGFNMLPIAELKGAIRVIGKLNSILNDTKMTFCGALDCTHLDRSGMECSLKCISIVADLKNSPICEMYEKCPIEENIVP